MEQEDTYQPIIIAVRIRIRDDEEPDAINRGLLEKKSHQSIVCKTEQFKREYTFDYIFDSNSTQFEVYTSVSRPLIKHFLSGNSGLAFIYGPTGTGKTYTMLGIEPTDSATIQSSTIGLLPRTFMHLHNLTKRGHLSCQLTLSVVEVFNNNARDLLRPATCSVSYVGNKSIMSLDDVVAVKATDYKHFKQLLAGAKSLAVDGSEAHTIYILGVEKSGKKLSGNIIFVHLAGSENVQNPDGASVEDSDLGAVQATLSALGSVIRALNDELKTIPYSCSKLTTLLRHHLTEDCQVSLIATLSSKATDIQECGNTLEFIEMLNLNEYEEQSPQTESTDPITELRIIESEIIKLRRDFNKATANDICILGAFDNKKKCLISNIHDLFMEIESLQTDGFAAFHNYEMIAENLVAEIAMGRGTSDSKKTSIEIKNKILYIQALLNLVLDYKETVRNIATTLEVAKLSGYPLESTNQPHVKETRPKGAAPLSQNATRPNLQERRKQPTRIKPEKVEILDSQGAIRKAKPEETALERYWKKKLQKVQKICEAKNLPYTDFMQDLIFKINEANKQNEGNVDMKDLVKSFTQDYFNKDGKK